MKETYLTGLADYFIANLPDERSVFHRNMKVLKKEYKDLEILEQKLSVAKYCLN